jgi:hypothetical protein
MGVAQLQEPGELVCRRRVDSAAEVAGVVGYQADGSALDTS